MVTTRNRFLSRLTNRDFVVEAIEEYDDLGPDQFFDKYQYVDRFGMDRKFAPSTLWPLYYRYSPDPSSEYPSKAIAAVAFHFQHGEPIREFSGGESTVVSRLDTLDPDGEYFRFGNPYPSGNHDFQELKRFIAVDMRPTMRAIYQPVFMRTLIQLGGAASNSEMAREIFEEDGGRLGGQNLYHGIVRKTPGDVLLRTPWVTFDEVSDEYRLTTDISGFSEHALDILIGICDETINWYRDKTAPKQTGWIQKSKNRKVDRDLERIREELYGKDELTLVPRDNKVRAMQEIAVRQGQPKFRRDLLEVYKNKCAITGCDVIKVLDACHIDPYNGSDSDRVDNGLILRGDLHTLFDANLLAIDTSDWSLILSDDLQGSTYSEELSRRTLSLPTDPIMRPDVKALDRHRQRTGL